MARKRKIKIKLQDRFKPKSFHLQWHITERCNLHCQHCYYDPKFLKNELEFSDLVKILEKFIKQIKIWQLPKENVRISFTGGEPFVKKEFFELLQKCYENQDLFFYGILTNGTLLNRENIKKIKDLKISYVQVSLEGMEKINDSIRGKGTFNKIIKALILLKKEKIPTSISMTVSKANVAEVPKVIKLAKELRIAVSIRRLVPIGRGRKTEKLFLSSKEVESLYSDVLGMKEKYWNQISLGCEDGVLAQKPRYFPEGCSAGYASFTVLSNGDVYPCRRLNIYSGNLLNQDFSDIYYHSKAFQELRNLNNTNKMCRSCPFFLECHGGAKCIAYAYFGSPFSPDPQCWRLFKKLPSKDLKWENINQKEERLDSKWVVNT